MRLGIEYGGGRERHDHWATFGSQLHGDLVIGATDLSGQERRRRATLFAKTARLCESVPMPATRKRIALFGSSFNPPHLGHLSVLKDLLAQNLFDEIWLLPVFKHPFRKDLPPYEDRLKLAKLLAEDVNDARVTVSRVEEELNKTPSYTVDTVTELKRRHPDAEFFIIAGSDVKADLPKWHRVEELQKLATFHFIPRQGFENSPYPQVSSTEIREKLKRGESVTGLTTDKIAAYLNRNPLYSACL